jgi:hypothetical protein
VVQTLNWYTHTGSLRQQFHRVRQDNERKAKGRKRTVFIRNHQRTCQTLVESSKQETGETYTRAMKLTWRIKNRFFVPKATPIYIRVKKKVVCLFWIFQSAVRQNVTNWVVAFSKYKLFTRKKVKDQNSCSFFSTLLRFMKTQWRVRAALFFGKCSILWEKRKAFK